MTQLSTPSEHDSDDEAHDAFNDPVAYFLDINSPTGNKGDNDIQTGNDNLNHESPRLFHRSILRCSILHTKTRRLSSLYNAAANANNSRFRWAMIDTSAARESTGGLAQYLAYCNYIGCRPKINTIAAATIHLGNGFEISQGTSLISFPIGAVTVTFAAHVLQEANAPLLTGIDEIGFWELYVNNLSDQLSHSDTGQFAYVIRDGQHPFILWNLSTKYHYTTLELKRLHLRFGHPHTDKLMNLLRKADLDKFDKKNA